jgi:hypothetical protein
MQFSIKKLSKLYKKSLGKQTTQVNSENLTQKVNNDIFVIEKGIPEPLRKISYSDQLRIIETLKQLNPGDSFSIKKEMMHPVRKMTNMYFPEYKVRIMQTGDSYRVFRRA